MKFDEKGNAVFETSGRTFYTNGGIIGIGPDLRPYEGYDGHFGPFDRHSWSDKDNDPPLSPEELVELAEHMIGRWQRLRDLAKVGKVQPWLELEQERAPVQRMEEKARELLVSMGFAVVTPSNGGPAMPFAMISYGVSRETDDSPSDIKEQGPTP